MQTPLEIIFQGMDPSPAVETAIRERVEKLEHFYNGITSCHVYVDAPHHHHHQGNLYQVRIEVRVPGAELTVNRKPGDLNAHEDMYVAVRDAFDAMERQLFTWKDKVSGRVKTHEPPLLQGRIVEIYPQEGYGRVATTDYGMVYFHRNSVVGIEFGELHDGDPVELEVRAGESELGPQASTLRRIRETQFVNSPQR